MFKKFLEYLKDEEVFTTNCTNIVVDSYFISCYRNLYWME